MNYHAHVYFEAGESEKAEDFLASARALGGVPLQTHKIFTKLVGPHAKPMVELRFSEATQKDAIAWIEAHRNNWSVLIHQDTGDDVRDHTEEVLWLGKPLPVHFKFFKLIESLPDLIVHKQEKP